MKKAAAVAGSASVTAANPTLLPFAAAGQYSYYRREANQGTGSVATAGAQQ